MRKTNIYPTIWHDILPAICRDNISLKMELKEKLRK